MVIRIKSRTPIYVQIDKTTDRITGDPVSFRRHPLAGGGMSPIYPVSRFGIKVQLLQPLKNIAEVHFLRDDSMEILDLYTLLLH